MKDQTLKKVAFAYIVFLTILVAASADAYFVTLTWTAPGDDGYQGRAAYYELRYSPTYITAQNWESAERFEYTTLPNNPGHPEHLLVTGLKPATSYYFAIRTADEQFNWSPISNVVAKTTPAQCCFGTTGNVDCDPNDLTDLGDLTVLISFLFGSPKPLCCPEEANFDGDPRGSVDLGDLTQLIVHLFQTPVELSPCK